MYEKISFKCKSECDQLVYANRSVGCIMYEMCCLEHAFSGQGLMAVMYKIVEKDPPDLPQKYSRDLNKVFRK